MRHHSQASFSFAPASTFKTEGIKYAGSKSKLLKHIIPEISGLPGTSVLDGFAGTTRVSQALAQLGLNVTVNDRAIFSKTFGECYLLGDPSDLNVDRQLKHLNELPGCAGWYREHYGGDDSAGSAIGADGHRKPWQRHNTMRLDAIRPEIDRIAENEINRSILLTSLIMALDAVDNTLGHYAAYLARWSPRSFNHLQLQKPAIIGAMPGQQHRIFAEDIFELISKNVFDICYFDPPYGSNNEKMPPSRVRYGAYYHIWKTIILNDKPDLFGKVKRRSDSRDTVDYSPFEDYKRDEEGRFLAVSAIDRLLRFAQTDHIVLSYSSGGRATFENLLDVIGSNGKITKGHGLDWRMDERA